MSNGHHQYSAQWWRERFNPPPPTVNFDRSQARLVDEDYAEARRIIEAHTGFTPGDVKSVRISTESGYVVISMRVYVLDAKGRKFVDPATDEAAIKLEIVTIDVPTFYEAFNG